MPRCGLIWWCGRAVVPHSARPLDGAQRGRAAEDEDGDEDEDAAAAGAEPADTDI